MTPSPLHSGQVFTCASLDIIVNQEGRASLHRLAFPATAAGDAHNAAYPRSKYPNAKYSPYDVYTISKDSKGRLWFGTSNLGACR